MIKLKKLIKESTWANRKFGEPLPTMADYKKAHEGKLASEGILNEKKELDSKTIQAVAKMTDSNAHTHARIELSQALRNKRLEKAYRGIYEVENFFNDSFGIEKIRTRIDQYLKRYLQNKFSNFDEIWGAL